MKVFFSVIMLSAITSYAHASYLWSDYAPAIPADEVIASYLWSDYAPEPVNDNLNYRQLVPTDEMISSYLWSD